MHARLAAADPQAAETIPAGNTRRVVRALEVVELTGRPYIASLPDHRYAQPAVQIGLELPRSELNARITDRVDVMWQRGLVDEVRALEREGLRQGRTASRALGYSQVLRHLAGEWTEAQAREETVRATRRFARRQDGWFRRDPRISWWPAGAADLADQVLVHLAGLADLSDPR
jgi:tRNA dimethylallyltransferase